MSLYNMHFSKIINSSNYVSKPVEKIINDIIESKSNKIILTGPRCGGKSIVLNAYEKNMLYSGEDAIYVFLEPGLENELLSDKQITVRYELFLCSEIMFYLEDHYYEKYKVYFRDMDNDIKEKNNLLYDYLNNFLYEKRTFPKLISSQGELLESVIRRMKKVIGNDILTICLDRFDWRNQPNNKKFQKMAEFYFQLFDKVVLTTDDKSVYENIENRRDTLMQNGYEVLEVDYGKDIDIAKKIIDADLRYYATKNHYRFKSEYANLEKLIDGDVYNTLLRKCNGNFGLMYATLREFFCSWYSFDDISDNNRRILKYFDWVMASREELEKSSYAKKLYL